MKVGDKLICKKCFVADDIKFEIGHKYEVDNIEPNGIRMKFTKIHFALFSLYDNIFCGYIYDYFQSPEDIRKKKLDSL